MARNPVFAQEACRRAGLLPMGAVVEGGAHHTTWEARVSCCRRDPDWPRPRELPIRRGRAAVDLLQHDNSGDGRRRARPSRSSLRAVLELRSFPSLPSSTLALLCSATRAAFHRRLGSWQAKLPSSFSVTTEPPINHPLPPSTILPPALRRIVGYWCSRPPLRPPCLLYYRRRRVYSPEGPNLTQNTTRLTPTQPSLLRHHRSSTTKRCLPTLDHRHLRLHSHCTTRAAATRTGRDGGNVRRGQSGLVAQRWLDITSRRRQRRPHLLRSWLSSTSDGIT